MHSKLKDLTLQLDGVTKSFGPQTVLDDCNLSVATGEFVTLLGPSGCGKSTSLNLIAGFLTPDSGTIYLRNLVANNLPPQKRNLGMVFQSWALFPHMTVFDNVAFGLRTHGEPKPQIDRQVDKMLDLVKLSGSAKKYPSQLSGGMQQRVALARALATNPSVLLLDEPLSNLDASLRKEMQVHIKHIHEQLAVTTLLVTHSQEEALVMSDRIAVMREGRIERIAEPTTIYNDPGTTFVSRFLGETNLLEGFVREVVGDRVLVEVDGWFFTALSSKSHHVGSPAIVSVRPEQLILTQAADDLPAQLGATTATVVDVIYKGSHATYYLEVKGLTLTALVTTAAKSSMLHSKGDSVLIHFDPGAAAFVARSSGDA